MQRDFLKYFKQPEDFNSKCKMAGGRRAQADTKCYTVCCEKGKRIVHSGGAKSNQACKFISVILLCV